MALFGSGAHAQWAMPSQGGGSPAPKPVPTTPVPTTPVPTTPVPTTPVPTTSAPNPQVPAPKPHGQRGYGGQYGQYSQHRQYPQQPYGQYPQQQPYRRYPQQQPYGPYPQQQPYPQQPYGQYSQQGGYGAQGYYQQPGAYPGYNPAYPPAEQPRDDDDEGSGFAFDLLAGTQFPLGFGPQLALEIPARILFQAELAWMPGFYSSAIVGMIESFGDEDALLGDVADDALSNSFVFRIGAGWRPFPSAGFEILGGYTTVATSGEASARVVGRVIGGELGRTMREEVNGRVDVKSQLHNVHITLGWRWLLVDDHMVIRAQLGYTQTVAANSSLDLPGNAELESRIQPVFDRKVGELLTSDVKLPVMGLMAGYRF